MFSRLIFCCAVIFMMTACPLALAQAPRESDIDTLDRQLRTPPAPRSQPRPRVTEDAAGQPRFDQSLRFTLSSLAVEGATVFTAEELTAPYAGRLGQSVSFDEINRIAEEMSKKYRDAGYLLSRVALPAQEVEPSGARIRLAAIEGFISQIAYTGNEDLKKRVSGYFASQEQKLLSRRPLQHKDFERAMLLLSDVPGLTVSSTFQEARVPGGSVLVISVEHKAVDAHIGWSNTGTQSSGPGMISAGLGLASVPAIGARTSLNYTQANDFREYYNIAFSQSYQLANGLSFNASYAYSDSPKPGSEFADLFDYATESRTFNFGANYAVIRSRDMNLSLGATFNLRNSEAELLDAPYTRDRLRSLNFNANFDFADELGGVTQILPSFTRGLKAFNATDRDLESSSPLARAEYSKGNLYMSRNQSLPANFSLMLTGELQVAGSVLPSYEQFSLGGGQFGRGYDPGAVESDNGAAGSLELRWTRYIGEKAALQPYAFLDGGTAWTKGRIDGVDPHGELSSAGLGVRLFGETEHFLNGFNLDAYVGKPLKTIDGDSSPRYILSTSFSF